MGDTIFADISELISSLKNYYRTSPYSISTQRADKQIANKKLRMLANLVSRVINTVVIHLPYTSIISLDCNILHIKCSSKT